MAAATFFLLFLATVMTSLVMSGHEDDVRCLSCTNVAIPEQCVSYERCNLGEVCFTHEVFDHNGVRSFRLGCESEDLCALARKAQETAQGPHIIGRQATDTTEPPEPQQTLCFQCCSQDDCNAVLCEEVYGLNRTEPRPTSPPGNCPPAFVKGPSSCLYINPAPVRWSLARRSCQQLGGDLVKVEDRTEDLFIVSRLKLENTPPSSRGYWTGGHRDLVTNDYLWLDHTPVNYTRWGRGEPNKEHNNDYFILYSSPAIFSSMPNWDWADYEDRNPLLAGFICERNFV